ncbi:MAG: SpoIID/LytB domain-containing protein [Deltaproteobacteria bacterium]|nr:SpoIID/LytB domain-containing protein [Deltaproteobacteria bacterium]
MPLAALALLLALPATPGESVRIAVGRFPDVVEVKAQGLVVIADGTSAPADKGYVRITAGKGGPRVAGRELKADVVRLEAPGTLALRGHTYHQRLEVQWRRYDGKPELLVVHPLDLETYVAGIVSSELPGGWPLEAYKAQAVAARTFALWQKYRRLDLPYHLEASVLDQVYQGVEREHALAQQAARETMGEVLTWRHLVAQAYFHASCGDRTESAREGWGTELPYLPGSTCGTCKLATRYGWNARIARADVDRALAPLLGEPLVAVSVKGRTASGRAKGVLLAGKTKQRTITAADLRRLLGYSTVWSTFIDKLAFEGGALVVHGKGSGHGVGLCQWGARGLADDGVGYREILARYYPGATLRRAY